MPGRRGVHDLGRTGPARRPGGRASRGPPRRGHRPSRAGPHLDRPDGRATRLSDLRGKVVLLSFREVGEGPFEDEPAYAARHAARLKGRPFALVAVDSPDAPIRNRLGVGRSGAAILVDAAGRFRFQGRESRLLGSYIDALVKEAEAGKGWYELEFVNCPGLCEAMSGEVDATVLQRGRMAVAFQVLLSLL